MVVLGIDPGLSGAFAQWDGEELILYEIPSVEARTRGREVNWPLLWQDWSVYFWEAQHVYLERVSSRPKEGVASAFKFGTVFGGLRAMVAAKELPLTMVTPHVWKKHYGIMASKKGAVLRASELFPGHADMFRGPRGGMKDGVAEAALIARYGYNQLRGAV